MVGLVVSVEVVSSLCVGVGLGDCLRSFICEVFIVGSVEVSDVGSDELSGVGSAGAEIQEHRQFSRGFTYSFLFLGKFVNCGGESIKSRGVVVIGGNEGVGVGVGEGDGVLGLGRSTTIFLNFFLPDRFVRNVGYFLSFLLGNWQLLRSPNNISWHWISFPLSSLNFLRVFTKGKVS